MWGTLRACAVMATLALVSASAPAATAQQQGFLVEFNFETLWFRVYPDGLGANGEKDGGSGLSVFAENVAVLEVDAVDLRHCIDGWGYPECSYGQMLAQFQIGNKNGQAEENEVVKFQQLAILGVGQIQKVQNLSRMLKDNVTLDGFNGGNPRPVALAVRDAEGDVNSTEPAYVDVTMEVEYENDAGAKRHELQLQSLHLRAQGFEYNTAKWAVVSGDKWEFKPSDTVPLTYQTKVTKEGWSSSQTEFEAATQNGLTIVLEKEKKKSPGLEFVALLGGLAVALAVMRRRR